MKILRLIAWIVFIMLVLQILNGTQVDCHAGLAINGNGISVDRCSTWNVTWKGNR